jgi:ABC-2 type transport system permease protein
MRPGLVLAFLRRDASIARSYRLAFALQTVTGAISLFVIFKVSQLIAPIGFTAAAGLDTDFFSWVVVGLAVLRVAQPAVTALGARLRSEQVTGTLEAIVASPAAFGAVALACVGYDLLLATIQAVMLVLVGAVAFGLQLHVGVIAAAAAVTALLAGVACLFAFGALLGSVNLITKQAGPLGAAATGLMAIVAGVYFPVAMMPGALAAVAHLVPLTWALEVVRAALLTGTVPVGSLLATVITAVLTVPLSLFVLRRALDEARSAGSVAAY